MNKINELLAQVKQIAMRIWHQLSAVFNRLRQSIMTLPRVSKYANESNASKGQFYLGTVYLTIKGIVKRFFSCAHFRCLSRFGYWNWLRRRPTSRSAVPSIAQLDKQINHPEQSSTLYYADMQKISDIKSDIKATHISKNKLTPLVKQAVISTEDETFYDHSGVLPKSLIRAIFSELTGIGVRTGGSTLTQQLVKMQFLTNQTTWKRKVIEMFFCQED
ncbi:transglycosylase domain-containing protein [Amylolactobacillus amylophilus]|uniref:transglycosylase domain-containing protein n=1 Tax=Amylolactobacillus amylophilus TaxID=1603 RepID=UPI000AABFC9E|nr:biosynthetic peptidoglycan transglycosylase [Amylolactobacillus amylophilus]